MIDNKPLVVATFTQEDTTLTKYRLAKLGTSAEHVVAAVDASALIIGVTDESADSTANNPVGVVMQGIAKLCVAASGSTKGAAITGTTAGKGLVTTTAADYCVGWLLKTTTANNEVVPVLVNPFIYAIS